jgi:hypothetical protein
MAQNGRFSPDGECETSRPKRISIREGVPPTCGISLSEGRCRKLNQRMFGLSVMIAIVLRNQFQSLRPVLKDARRDRDRDLSHCLSNSCEYSFVRWKNDSCRPSVTCSKQKKSDGQRFHIIGQCWNLTCLHE